MSDHRCVALLAGGAITALVLVSALAPATADADAEVVQSAEEPETTEPTTAPDPTEPDSIQPDSTEPDTTEPVAVDSDGDAAENTVAVIAVIGFGALIALASWWMVRRRDVDDVPHPPAPDEPLPGQDLF